MSINDNYQDRQDSINLYKELTSFGSNIGIMSESIVSNNERDMPNQQYNGFQNYGNNNPQYVEVPSYDPMSEFDMSDTNNTTNTDMCFVEQSGEGVNTRYNVKDSRTGQTYASCILKEASDKIATLMNEGKLFTDMEVMKCIMTDTKFSQVIHEMRQIKSQIDSSLNESTKQSLKNKLNEMKVSALELKNKLK